MPSYVVVGSTGTIGGAMVQRLAANPENTVIGLSRRASDPPVPGVTWVRGDLSDLESLKAATDEIMVATKGKLDVLILASSQPITPNPTMGQGEESQIAESILGGVAQTTVGSLQFISLLLPLLRQGTIKKVVHITSAHGNPNLISNLPMPVNLGLSTCKGALDIIFSKLAKDFRADGFTFISITPTLVQKNDGSASTAANRERLTKLVLASFPDFSGIYEPDDGARIILDSIDRLGQESSGKVFGMWGTQDKWA